MRRPWARERQRGKPDRVVISVTAFRTQVDYNSPEAAPPTARPRRLGGRFVMVADCVSFGLAVGLVYASIALRARIVVRRERAAR